MKDFLPILIGIIWLGYKYYQKTQKKIQEQETNASTKEPYSEEVQHEYAPKSLDDLMEIFFGNQKEEKLAPPIPQPQNYESVEDNYSEIEAYSTNEEPIDNYKESDLSLNEGVEYTSERASDKARNRKHFSEEIEQDFDNEDIMDDFDIEKAIIYNAILNRPYS